MPLSIFPDSFIRVFFPYLLFLSWLFYRMFLLDECISYSIWPRPYWTSAKFCLCNRYIHFHCGIHNDNNRSEVNLGRETVTVKQGFRCFLPFAWLVVTQFMLSENFIISSIITPPPPKASNPNFSRNQQKGSKHWTCSISKYCLKWDQCQLQQQV